MDRVDIFALSGFEWVYDRVERRYGRAVAWLATLSLAGATIAIVMAVLVAIF